MVQLRMLILHLSLNLYYQKSKENSLCEKKKRTYYFSVEGETEDWYLKWLQQEINNQSDATYLVKLESKVQKDPLSYAKRIPIVEKTEITHIFDYESGEPVHRQQFLTTLERMKQAEHIGKDITYRLRYSNFTFELWMILHMTYCSRALTHRRQYITLINNAYQEQFENLDQYKHEKNFKRILGKLSIEHVKMAVRCAKAIMEKNEESDYVLQQYKGYQYYNENPSLPIWKIIERILKDCKLI